MPPETQEDLKSWLNDRLQILEKSLGDMKSDVKDVHGIVVGGVRDGEVRKGLAVRVEEVENELKQIKQNQLTCLAKSSGIAGAAGAVIGGFVAGWDKLAPVLFGG